jgi:hypothetical protein
MAVGGHPVAETLTLAHLWEHDDMLFARYCRR